MNRKICIATIAVLIMMVVLYIVIQVCVLFDHRVVISEYYSFKEMAEQIENSNPGRAQLINVSDGNAYVLLDPGFTADDCLSIVLSIADFRTDSGRADEVKYVTFTTDRDDAKGYTLFFPKNIGFEFSFSDSGEEVFRVVLGPEADDSLARLSSFSNFNIQFEFRTMVSIELDDKSVFSKVTAWHSFAGLFTADQLIEIEAKGISVSVWGEDIS